MPPSPPREPPPPSAASKQASAAAAEFATASISATVALAVHAVRLLSVPRPGGGA